MRRSRYQQPWERVDVGTKKCRVQILDPETALGLEPKLVGLFGDQLALALAAPGYVAGKLLDHASEDDTGARLLVELAGVTQLVQACLLNLHADFDGALEVMETMLLGRVEVAGHGDIETWGDWVEAFGHRPGPRWRLLAAALRLTYGPLWSRSPYTMRSTTMDDFGVPAPPGVSDVRMWAEQIAARGSAPSAHDVLTQWTPVEVIESVEALAYTAERERRAYIRARGEQR